MTLAIDHERFALQRKAVGGNQLGYTTTKGVSGTMAGSSSVAEILPDASADPSPIDPARPASLCADHQYVETQAGRVGASPTFTADQRVSETHKQCVCGNPLSDDHEFNATQDDPVVADLPSDQPGTETQLSTVGGSL